MSTRRDAKQETRGRLANVKTTQKHRSALLMADRRMTA